MFRRKPKPEVSLDEASYTRWLKACRPQPISWFLGLPEGEQSALARIGEAYTADIIVALGLSSQNEAAAYAVYSRVDKEAADAAMLQTLSEAVASQQRKASGIRTGAKYGQKPTTMSGVVAEREKAEQARQTAGAPSFLGRKADA